MYGIIKKLGYFICCIKSIKQSDKYYVYESSDGKSIAAPINKFSKKWGIPRLGVIKVSNIMDTYPDVYISERLVPFKHTILDNLSILRIIQTGNNDE